jgi:hypothetical protein
MHLFLLRNLLWMTCLVAGVAAQGAYEQVRFHAGKRACFGFEFDATRGEVLAFGGADWPDPALRGWTGSHWTQYSPSNPGPLPRAYVTTTSDPANGKIYLYGGVTHPGTFSSELWQWDGVAWTLLSTGGPSPRLHTALAFDSATGSLYLFGGVSPTNFPLGDLWRWNGAWTNLPGNNPKPTARHNHTMAWDPGLGSSGGLLIFGGDSYYTGERDDTWLWTAAGGFVQAATISPGYQSDHAMCRDAARNRIVLLGYDDVAHVSTTWEWDGTSWQQQFPATVPDYRRQARLAYDPVRQRAVLYGNASTPAPESEFSVWEWDGVNWQSGSSELGGAMVSSAYDEARRVQVLLASRYVGPLSPFVSTTWEWDGTVLQKLAIAGPSARLAPLLWYDPVVQRTMLFGGQGLSTTTLNNDTWQFDGVTWQQLAPANQPSPRIAAALAYDPTRQRAVLFGGFDVSDLQETWEWDGTSWAQATPAVSPSPRSAAALGFDPILQRVVLFGGARGATLTSLDDTWTWDGVNWQQLQPTVQPPERHSAYMVHDRDRNRLMLLGGVSYTAPTTQLEAWAWSGSNWSLEGQLPIRTQVSGASYDSQRGRTQLMLGTGERLELALPSVSVGLGNPTADPSLACPVRPALGGSLQLVATTAQPGPMFALVAFGVPQAPVTLAGPFCQPTSSFLPGSALVFPMVTGSVSLALPAQPYLAFLAMTAQVVQLRGSCADASNALAIRLQPR